MAGNYQVRETDGVGYISVADADGFNPNLIDVALAPGQTAADRDFVDAIVPGTIGDLVWYDTDGNGVKGGSEVGIPGVVISLTNSAGSVVTTTTNATGIYTFTNLLTGAYTVTVMSGMPVSATAINLGDSKISPYTVNLGIGQVITNADFGYDLTPAYTLSKVLITGQPARTREVISFRIAITNTGEGVIDFLPWRIPITKCCCAMSRPAPAGQQRQRRHPQLGGPDQHPGPCHRPDPLGDGQLRGPAGHHGPAQRQRPECGHGQRGHGGPGRGPSSGQSGKPAPTADAATVIIQGPTGVTLINASVRPLTLSDSTQVEVAWATVNELNVVGFHVYRTGPEGAAVQ